MKRIVPARLRPSGLTSQLLRRLRSEGRVAGGIFAGMRYTGASFYSANSPKLLGSYEIELKEIFDSLWPLRFSRIVVVGAAEGYYAVGCALKWPSALVVAYESSAEARTMLRQVAELNGVNERMDVRERCTDETLREALGGDGAGLLIMDVEGDEVHLLAQPLVTALSSYHIVVEVHDFVNASIAASLRERFEISHVVKETWTRPRRLSDFEYPQFLPLRWYMLRGLRASAKEYRPGPMRWFYLAPRAGEGQMALGPQEAPVLCSNALVKSSDEAA